MDPRPLLRLAMILLLAAPLAACADSSDADSSEADPAETVSVRFDAVDFSYEALDLTGIAAGDTVRFEMENSGEQPHEFEVLDPQGVAIGEVAAVGPGASGEATMTFEEPGTYRYQCILVDEETEEPHTMLGMAGTFEVAAR